MTPPDPGFPITLDGLLKVWHLIGTPIFAVVAYYVRDVGKQLRAINGRIIALETSTKANEKATRRELDQIQVEIRGHPGRGESGP